MAMGPATSGGMLGGPGMGTPGGMGLSGGPPGMGGFAGGPGSGFGKESMKLPGMSGLSSKPSMTSTPAGPASLRDIRVVPLKHAVATSLAKSLHELFADGSVRIVAESQTNTLLIQADAKTYELIQKLLERLDQPAERK